MQSPHPYTSIPRPPLLRHPFVRVVPPQPILIDEETLKVLIRQEISDHEKRIRLLELDIQNIRRD